MSGIDTKAKGFGVGCALPDLHKQFMLLARVAGVGIFARVDLNHIAANFTSQVNLFADWIDEEADGYLVLMKGLNDPLKVVLVCPDVQPIFGRQFPAVFGYEGNEIRSNIECYPDNFVGGPHFKIEFSFDGLPEGVYICIADMAAVFPEMADDAAGAGSFADPGRPRGVGFRSPAGIPQCRNMVYVNGQTHSDLAGMITNNTNIRKFAVYGNPPRFEQIQVPGSINCKSVAAEAQLFFRKQRRFECVYSQYLFQGDGMKLLSRLSLVVLFAIFFLPATGAQSKKNDTTPTDNHKSAGQRIGLIVEEVINSMENTIYGRPEDNSVNKSTRALARTRTFPGDEIDLIAEEDTSVTYEGNTVIEKTDTVNSNVVVKAGTLTVYGRINGDVLVVGGDVKIKDRAYISGNVKVINGEVMKDDDAVVVGYIDKSSSRKEKAYREEAKDFRRASTRLNATWVPEATNLDNFIFRYNRVEGVFLGMGSEKRYYWDGQKLFSTYGSVGYGFKSHNWRGNLGLSRQFAFDDGQLFEFEIEGHSMTDSKEDWLIGLGENTAAAFFIHEDFRDYFRRDGFGVNAGYAMQQDYLTAQVKVGYLSDEYKSMTNQAEWSLFGGHKVFRPNPLINEGMMRSVVGSAGLSTVTTTIYGPQGWSILATAEVAMKSLKSDFEFNRYVGDIRRYQPLGRYNNLNVRVRVGSSEGMLPIQKAFDMGGLGTIPAFPFKGETGNRMLLMNAELVINGDFLGDLDFWPSWLLRAVNFVVFSDAGLVRMMPATAQWTDGFDTIHFSDFQHDVGVGVGTRSGSVRVAFVWRTDRSEPARLMFRIARPF